MKTSRTVTLKELGITTYSKLNSNDIELIVSIADTHPKQFWGGLKIILPLKILLG